MFRGFLDHNSFVALLKTAVVDGFNAKFPPTGGWPTKDDQAREEARSFGRVAQICAPETLRVSTEEVEIPNEDQGVIMGEPRKETRTTELSSILGDAWIAGYRLREKSEERSGSYEEWKQRLNCADKMQEVLSKNLDKIANGVAERYPDLLEKGSYPKAWKLMLQPDVSVGTYHGPELREGDYVEYQVGYPAKVLGIDGDKADVIRVGEYAEAAMSPRRTPGQVENLTNVPSGPMISLEESLRRVLAQPKKVAGNGSKSFEERKKNLMAKAEPIHVEAEEPPPGSTVASASKEARKTRKTRKARKGKK